MANHVRILAVFWSKTQQPLFILLRAANSNKWSNNIRAAHVICISKSHSGSVCVRGRASANRRLCAHHLCHLHVPSNEKCLAQKVRAHTIHISQATNFSVMEFELLSYFPFWSVSLKWWRRLRPYISFASFLSHYLQIFLVFPHISFKSSYFGAIRNAWKFFVVFFFCCLKKEEKTTTKSTHQIVCWLLRVSNALLRWQNAAFSSSSPFSFSFTSSTVIVTISIERAYVFKCALAAASFAPSMGGSKNTHNEEIQFT